MDSMDTTQNYILSTANLRQALITHVVSTIRNICQIESLDVSLKRTTKKILTRYSPTRTCQEVRARAGEKLRSANRKITPVVLFTTAYIYILYISDQLLVSQTVCYRKKSPYAQHDCRAKSKRQFHAARSAKSNRKTDPTVERKCFLNCHVLFL